MLVFNVDSFIPVFGHSLQFFSMHLNVPTILTNSSSDALFLLNIIWLITSQELLYVEH